LAVLLLWAGLFAARKWTTAEAEPSIPGRILHARHGRIERTLRVSGTLSADRAAMLLAPRMSGRRSRSSGASSDFQIILQRLAPAGARLEAGGFLAEFDRQYMLARLDDYRADADQRREIARKVEAGIAVKRAALDQRILAARAAADKARLNMKTLPVRGAIQAEKFRLQLEEAEAYLKALLAEARYFDASERAELRRQQLLLTEEEMELRRAGANVEKLRVAAPIGGIVVPGRIRRGQEYGDVEAGDEIRSGYPFVQVMDPDSLVLNASLNQVDSHRVRSGMRARVLVDAIPAVVLPGRVTAVGALAAGNRYRPDWVRTLNVKVALDRIDRRVYPNFSASADLILEEGEGLIVPRECVTRDGEGEGRVRIWSGGQTRTMEAGLGVASATEVLVTGGLEGDEDLVCGFVE
jgi:hypothetical protein